MLLAFRLQFGYDFEELKKTMNDLNAIKILKRKYFDTIFLSHILGFHTQNPIPNRKP